MRLKVNVNRLLEKDRSYALSIVYELCFCAQSILNERNGSKTEHENKMTYGFDEHVAYMLKSSSEKDETTPQWDMNKQQNMLCANEDTGEN